MFTRWSIVTRATRHGRISLEAGRLIVTRNGQRTERLPESDEECHALLKEHFGVELKNFGSL